jgi:hypothetical protein
MIFLNKHLCQLCLETWSPVLRLAQPSPPSVPRKFNHYYIRIIRLGRQISGFADVDAVLLIGPYFIRHFAGYFAGEHGARRYFKVLHHPARASVHT